MMIKGIDVVTLPVQDMARAVNFYENVLGFSIIHMQDTYKEFLLNDQAIGLMHNEGYGIPFSPNVGGAIAFSVEDIHQAKTYFTDKGVNFHGEIIDTPGVCYILTFSDTEGNSLMLHQCYPNRGF
jgi:predicted enzyme related to lactoylglutathione lyase